MPATPYLKQRNQLIKEKNAAPDGSVEFDKITQEISILNSAIDKIRVRQQATTTN